ncbi:MAG TPA: MFS transporter [Fimbriimonadaceae bacterium]|jgi:MFS-type transporter involved in bile tolerance (Atg22 family)
MSQPTNRLQNLANLRIANADGALASAFGALSMGSILFGFVKYLNGSDIWIGVLTALSGSPSVFGLLLIPGAIWSRRFPTYKKFITPGGNLWRLFYAPLIVLPLLHIDAQIKLWILLICVSIATAATLIVNTAYNEWLAQLVPESSRGWYYARRNALCTIVGAIAALAGGILLDQFTSHGLEDLGFSVVFGIGSIFSAISVYYYYQMGDTPRPQVVKQGLGETVKELGKPVRDKNYRALLIFMGALFFANTFPGNFFTAFALESLKLPFTVLTLQGLAQAVGTVVASPFVGFLSDKYGNKPVLILFGFFLTVTPVMWLLCYPNETIHNAAVLLPISVLVGVVWAAVNLAQFNIILATSPPEERSSYISVALTVQNTVGFISPLLGAFAMAWLRAHTSDPIAAYKMLFGITMGLRFLSIFTLSPVVEKGAIQVRQTLRDLTRITPRGYSAMRSLSRSSDVTEREEAIARVAEHGVSMAVDELIKSLHDPSPRIRRQASIGLARLGDPAAVEALLHQLADHPDLVEDETIDALGQLAGPEAVGPITKLLQDPRSLVRRAAVRALGRIGDPSAVPELIEIAQIGDPDIRRAALRALWSLGAGDVEEIFAQSLLDPAPSVRIAAAEGVSEMVIKSARLQAVDSLHTYHDEASSEVAYALAAIGSDEDIPIILETAAECVSMITRRRCLLGVAKLLGVESAAYRLLLLDGMSRDTTLMALIRPLTKKSKRIAVAFEKYSAGDEAGALSAVAHALKQPVLQFMARQPVDELFLIVVCYLGKG